MFDYKALIDLQKYKKLKSIPVVYVSENTVFKSLDLVLPYLAYKFLYATTDDFIFSYVHKPQQVINDNANEINIGRITCKLYNSRDIYSVVYIKDKVLSSTVYANFIISAYTIFSNLFVRCKLRFISKEPSYVAFVSPHGSEVLTSLRDIFNRYGIVDDKVFYRRLNKALRKMDNDSSKSDNK